MSIASFSLIRHAGGGSLLNPLSRTSSASSVSSIDTTISFDDVAHDDAPRRTRKRFTSVQLMALEQLYHQSSHPTREQREIVAREAGIELRSVTVWFQNKRQTERKAAGGTSNDNASNSNNHPSAAAAGASTRSHSDMATPFPSLGSTARSRRISNASSSRSPPLTASPSLSSTSSGTSRTVRNHASRPQLSSHRRPSLDQIASRAERPMLVFAASSSRCSDRDRDRDHLRTPTRTRVRTQSSPNNLSRLYENMPSSPLGPLSPLITDRDRELIDFGLRKPGKTRPTLEWACAAARASNRNFNNAVDATTYVAADEDIEEMVLDVGGDTEDEGDFAHEAVTPSSSAGSDSRIWRRNRAARGAGGLRGTANTNTNSNASTSASSSNTRSSNMTHIRVINVASVDRVKAREPPPSELSSSDGSGSSPFSSPGGSRDLATPKARPREQLHGASSQRGAAWDEDVMEAALALCGLGGGLGLDNTQRR